MVKRDKNGRLLPGSVCNPKGRPPLTPVLSDYARKHTSAGELFDIFKSVAQGRPLFQWVDQATGQVFVGSVLPDGAQATSVVFPSTAERLRAAEFLWEKIEPPTKHLDVAVEARGERGPDFSKMAPEQLDRYIELGREMQELSEHAGAIDAESEEKKD